MRHARWNPGGARAVGVALVLAAGILAAALPPAASGGQRLELTLDEAIEIALESNRTIAIAEAAEDAARARLGQARSALLPRIAGSASYTKLDETPYMDASQFGSMFEPLLVPFNALVADGLLDPSTLEGLSGVGGEGQIPMGDDDIYSIGLSVSQPVFTGGGVLNAYWAAKHGARAEALSHRRTVAETEYAVTEAYVGLVRALAGLDVMETAVEQVRSHLRDLENFFEEGMILESEVMAARVRAAGVDLELNRAEHGVRLAGANLCFQMGIDVDTEIEPVDQLEGVSSRDLDLGAATSLALRTRPDLEAARESSRAASNLVGAARSRYLPQIVFIGSYNWDRPNRAYEPEFYENWSVTLAAELSIFDWGGIGNSVREAEAARVQAEKAAEMAEEAVRLEVKQSLLGQDESIAAVRIATDGAAQAREALRVTRENFRSGMSTNSDVLDAQSAETEAEMQLVDALANLILAEKRLELATGVSN